MPADTKTLASHVARRNRLQEELVRLHEKREEIKYDIESTRAQIAELKNWMTVDLTDITELGRHALSSSGRPRVDASHATSVTLSAASLSPAAPRDEAASRASDLQEAIADARQMERELRELFADDDVERPSAPPMGGGGEHVDPSKILQTLLRHLDAIRQLRANVARSAAKPTPSGDTGQQSQR